MIRFKSIGIIELKGFLDLSGILALFELACARLLVCWLKLCSLLDYNVISLASELSSSQKGLVPNGSTGFSRTTVIFNFNSNFDFWRN